jgi:hypothetical protein
MKEFNNKKFVVFIISITCIVFIVGMIFYKQYNYKKNTRQDTEVETIKKITTQAKPLSPSKKTHGTDKIKQAESEDTILVKNIQAEIANELPEEIPEEVISEETKEEEMKEKKPKETINILSTKSLLNHSGRSISDLQKEKTYYSDTNGRLESYLIFKENKIVEILVSYDATGQKVDELEIGLIEENFVKRKYAIISQDRISIYNITPAKKNKTEEEMVTHYTITWDLRFVEGKTYSKIL